MPNMTAEQHSIPRTLAEEAVADTHNTVITATGDTPVKSKIHVDRR